MKKYWDGILPKPNIRTVLDMEGVFYRSPELDPTTPLYYMYRDLWKSKEDHIWLEHNHLRYDITVIPPKLINGEYTKTKGHYHPKNLAGVSYPEVYEVLSGFAYYQLQRRDHRDVIIVPARPGDIIFIPPEYGHVTINPGYNELVMANIVSTEFSSEYTEIERLHGAACYYMKKEGWIPNTNYESHIPIHIRLPIPIPDIGIVKGVSLYEMIGSSCNKLDILNHPENYLNILEKLFDI